MSDMSESELKGRYDRLRRLYEVSRVLHSTLDPQEALQRILREAVRLMRASSGSVVLINPTTGFLEIQASLGLPPGADQLRLRVGEGITGWTVRAGRPARVGDVSADPRYVLVRPGVKSELAVPLEVAGEVRGVLNVDSDQADAFSAEDQQLLEDLAHEASRVIQNTWLYEKLRLRAGLFESLAKVSQTINSTVNLDETLEVITREACQLMDARVCALLLLDASGQWLELRAAHGAGPQYLNKPRLNIEDSLLGIVVRRKKPLQVENVQASARYQSADIARTEGLVSLLSVPLLFRNQPTGTLSVYKGQPHSFSNEEIRILSALAELSALAIEKARLYERVVDAEEHLRQNERLSALGLLAAEVAHEIRNPLTVMKMLYHSLDLNFGPDDPRARDVAVIRKKMDELNRIVEQILTFARRAEPKLTRVRVPQVIEDLSLLIRHKLAQQKVDLERKIEPDLPGIMADVTQLEQAFLNLILNALEAMPRGGQLTLLAYALPPRGSGQPPTRVILEFKDTGQGMSPDELQQAFSSLLQSSKTKGTGLGLPLVARIIEAHRGELKLESQPTQGTTVIVSLPVETQSE